MKLVFKQRLFSWFDNYEIFNEAGDTVFTVEGRLAWGHKLVICSPVGDELATVREKIFRLLPQFEVWMGEQLAGTIRREFTFFKPRYDIDFNGWHVEGSLTEWDYTITGADGGLIATVSKELFHLADTYVLDIVNPGDALCVLAFALAMDAEKCSRK